MRILYRYLYMPRVKDDWHKIWVFNQQEDNGGVNICIHTIKENFNGIDHLSVRATALKANTFWKELIITTSITNPREIRNLITAYTDAYYDPRFSKLMHSSLNTSSTNLDFLKAYLEWVQVIKDGYRHEITNSPTKKDHNENTI